MAPAHPFKLNGPLVAGGSVYVLFQISPDSDRVVYNADQDTDNVFELFASRIITISKVAIDIKPGSDPNSINLKSKGVIPVAILSTDTFDATTIDPLSVSFGPHGAMEGHGRGHIEDVNGDGLPDLVLHFRTQEQVLLAVAHHIVLR